MRHCLPLALLLALTALLTPSHAQISVPPESAEHAPVIATCEAPAAGEAGSVQILWEADAATQYVALEGGRTLHIWAPPGSHYLKASVFAVDWESRTFSVTQHRAEFRVIGGEPTPPPDPDPGPDPPDPKPTKVTAVIVRESTADSPAFARLVTSIRTGDNAKWLADGGHELLILDDDATDSQGRPLQLVAALTALGVPMPALFVLDGTNVVAKQTLAANATAADVMAVIRGAVE